MTVLKKKVIRENDQKEIRVKSLDWEGKRFGLFVDGELIQSGSFEIIERKYNNI